MAVVKVASRVSKSSVSISEHRLGGGGGSPLRMPGRTSSEFPLKRSEFPALGFSWSQRESLFFFRAIDDEDAASKLKRKFSSFLVNSCPTWHHFKCQMSSIGSCPGPGRVMHDGSQWPVLEICSAKFQCHDWKLFFCNLRDAIFSFETEVRTNSLNLPAMTSSWKRPQTEVSLDKLGKTVLKSHSEIRQWIPSNQS